MSEDFRAALEATYDSMTSGESAEADAVEVETDTQQISTESDQAQPVEAQTQAQPEPLQAPADWSESAKEAFAKAPTEIQQALLERSKEMQADYTRKTQEAARLRKHYEAVDQVIAPHAQYFAQQGLAPAQALERLMNAQIALDTDPASVILHLAQEKGVNLAQLAQQLQQSSAQGTHLPAIQQLTTKINQLEQQLAAQQESEVLNETLQEIQQWAGEKDEKGNLLRPHFEDVRPYLQGLCAQFRDEDPISSDLEILNRAYEEAVKPLKALEAKLMQDRKAKVEAARRAGVSVTSSPGIAVTDAAPKNTREALEQAWNQLSRR